MCDPGGTSDDFRQSVRAIAAMGKLKTRPCAGNVVFVLRRLSD